MGTEQRRRRVSFRGIAPNVVTILALSAGMTSIKFALADRWEAAVFAIVLAGIFDGIDGSVARLLKSVSKFGAELDSLSDVVSFGVAPAVLLYLWALQGLGGLGWVIALALVVCMALRLARFNSALDDEEEPRKRAGFLTGIPAPMGAGLALTPLMFYFETGLDIFQSPILVGVVAALTAFGMVSRLPTFSFRQVFIRREQMVTVLLAVGLLAAALTVYQWAVLLLIALVYVVSIPLAFKQFRTIQKNGQSRDDIETESD